MAEKNAQLVEMNKSLKCRLDNSNRLLEEATTEHDALVWQSKRDNKRSWDES